MNWNKQFEIIEKIAQKKFSELGVRYSLTQLETFLGATKNKASAWKRGQRPSADDLQRLGEQLGLSAVWLLYGEGDPEAEQNAPPGQTLPDQEQPGGLPDAALITRAVLDVESGMRRAGVREPVIWQAVKSMVDDKLAQLRQEQPDQSDFQEELESKALRTRTARDINEGESDTSSRNGTVAER